jgi:hypothetical protein
MVKENPIVSLPGVPLGTWSNLPSKARNNPTPTPKICGGTFGFGGEEGDAAIGGVFAGGIVEADSVNGFSGGTLERHGSEVKAPCGRREDMSHPYLWLRP